MNILSISSILPIPGRISHNDFVFQIYHHCRKLYPQDQVVIIKPVKIDFNIRTILKGKTRLDRLEGQYQWEIQGFRVEIFPYLSAYSLRTLHALLNRSIYYLNRKRLGSLFRDFAFDVIHAQYLFPDGVLARQLNKRFRVPYLLTTHNERYYFGRSGSRRMALSLMRKAAEITPLNHSNAQYFRSLGIKNQRLAPLGFDAHFLRPQRTPEKGPLRLFTAAALIPLKNIDKVIRALTKLDDATEISFTIIGKGPERGNLEGLVKELGLGDRVFFLEHIPHEKMADEMYRFDLFIMPSYFETFGRVYFECMAMGIPVICAKGSGIHGMFREGEEALSVDHRNIDEMAGVLKRLAEDPEERTRIGLNGQELVKDYTWEKVAEDLHQRYVSACSAEKGSHEAV